MGALKLKDIDRILKAIYEGDISFRKLPKLLSQFTFDEIISFVQKGFGELSSDFKTAKMTAYESNIVAFSGAKTFQQVKDINNFVFLPDGSKRPFKEFREFALKLTDQYNVRWLKTEQDTAFGVAQSADQWREFEEDKDIFPLLQYQTALDERVRDSHKAWDNIIRPVDDPFWDAHMPINGFNCRCTVIQLESGRITKLRGVPKNDDKLFSVNPGKVDYIFNEKKHPYFKHTKAEGPAFERAIKWD